MSDARRTGRLHVVLPTLRPAGGVVKVLDYVTHALAAGWTARVFAPDRATAELPVFAIERLAPLLDDDRVVFSTDPTSTIGPADLGFLSLPSQYPLLQAALRPGAAAERIVHIVQNVRHDNPNWQRGYATRLLARPMARIMTNDVVAAAVAPFQHRGSLSRTIPLGHPRGYFTHPDRGGLGRPLRVAHTTWKSEVGDAVATLVDGEGFEFRAIREHVGWTDLRELYHWCDVFLGTPNPEEGFYMPAFEAMEAGALVVVPDAGGNMAFCEFGRNCLPADLEDARSYAAALRTIAAMDEDAVEAMRAAAFDVLAPFDLDAERAAFGVFLDDVVWRVDAVERGGVDPRTLGTVGG